VTLTGQDSNRIQATVIGVDDFGYLTVREKDSSEVISVHPDGNSFDMMKGVIYPKVKR